MATPLAHRLTITLPGSTFVPGDTSVNATTNLSVTSLRRVSNPYIAEPPEAETQSLDPLTGQVSDAEASVLIIDADENNPGSGATTVGDDFEGDTDRTDSEGRGWTWVDAGSGVAVLVNDTSLGLDYMKWTTVLAFTPADVGGSRTFSGLIPGGLYNVLFKFANLSYEIAFGGNCQTQIGASSDNGAATGPLVAGGSSPGHTLVSGDWAYAAVQCEAGTTGDLTVSCTFKGVNAVQLIGVIDSVLITYIGGPGGQGRIITRYLADANARQQLLNRPAFIEQSPDAGATWPNPHFSGYVQSIVFLDALMVRITIGDTRRVERTRKAFRNIDPTVSGAPFTKVTPILGGPVFGGFAPYLPDVGLPLFEVKAVTPMASGVPGDITLEFVNGPLPDDFNGTFSMGPENGLETVNTRASNFLNASAPQGLLSDGGLCLGQYPQLHAWLFDPSTGDVTTFGAMMPLARLGFTTTTFPPQPITCLIDPQSKRTSWEFRLAIPAAMPAPGDRYRVLIAPAQITSEYPLHWSGHPVDFLTTLFDLAGIAWDVSSRDDVRTAMGDLSVALRFEDPEETVQDAAERIGGFFGLTTCINGDADDAARRFIWYGQRIDTTPTSSIATSDLGGDPQPFELDVGTIVNRVIVETVQFAPFAGKSGDARPADALIASKEGTFEFPFSSDGITDDADEFGDHPKTFALPGTVAFGVGPTPFNVRAYARGKAHDVFQRHARGAQITTLRTVGAPTSGTFDGSIGTPTLIDVDHVPNAQLGQSPISQRGGTRWARLLRASTTDYLTLDIRVIDESTGVAYSGGVTLVVADDVTDPLHFKTVEITGTGTLVSDGALLELEVAFGVSTPTDPGVRYTVLAPADMPADPWVERIGPVPVGENVWVRARAFPYGGAPGSWSSWTDNGGVIPTPTGDISNLVVGTPTTHGAALTWDNANSTGNVKIEARVTGTVPYTTSVVIPATSVAYTLNGLLDDTDYDVRVVLVDPLLVGPAAEFGTVLTDTFHTANLSGATQVPTPTVSGWAKTDPLSGSTFPGYFGAYVYPDFSSISPQDILSEYAVETSIGSGTPGSAILGALDVGMTPGAIAGFKTAIANTGKKVYVRATAKAIGFTDSSPSAWIELDPWAATPTIPAPVGPGPPLGTLTDVVLSSVADQDVLAYDTGSGTWVNVAPAAATDLNALSDVTITGPAAGDILIDVGTDAYANVPMATALGYFPIESLSNTGPLSGAATDDIPQFDGSDWQPVPVSSLGSAYIASPEATQSANANDNFKGASLDTAGTRRASATAWAWVNQGGATATLQLNRLELKAPSSASHNMRMILQAVPGGTWKYRARLAYINPSYGGTSHVGIVLRDSGSGKLEANSLGNSGGNIVWASNWSSATAFNATRTTFGITTHPYLWPTFLEIENDGTNYIYRHGMDELNMIELTRFAKTNYLASAADGIGLFAHNDVSQDTWLYCREFYRVA